MTDPITLTDAERESVAMILNHFAAASTPQSRETDLPRAVAAIESIVAARLAEVEAERDRHGPCYCGTPDTEYEGPVRECPHHGYTYAEWVERGDDMKAENARLRAQVARVEALASELADGKMYAPGQCCSGYCIDGLHDLDNDQARDLRTLLRAAIAGDPDA